MKTRIGVAAMLAGLVSVAVGAPEVVATSTPPGVAVVELYTSEGCSSCPPADEVLRKLGAEARAKQDAGLIVLAWHVDYWNDIGWRDPFSSPRWSERQRRMCAELKTNSVYTPQMVVNGQAEFVGNREPRARATVLKVRGAKPAVSVTDLAVKAGEKKGTLAVRWSASKAENAEVEVILTEDGLASSVTSGENSGRRLGHDGVVRSLTTQPLAGDGKGAAVIEVPAGVKLERARVAVVVRKKNSAMVLGAAASDVVPMKTQTPGTAMDSHSPAPATK